MFGLQVSFFHRTILGTQKESHQNNAFVIQSFFKTLFYRQVTFMISRLRFSLATNVHQTMHKILSGFKLIYHLRGSLTNQLSVHSLPSSMINPNAIFSYPDVVLVASRRMTRAQSCICTSKIAGLVKTNKDRISLRCDEKPGTKYRRQRVNPFSDDRLYRDCTSLGILFHKPRENVALKILRNVVHS